MILVCPSCDAKFKIPDGAIPAEGRTVRCAKCKNSWHATPQQIMRKPAPKPTAPRPASSSVAAPARPPAPEPQGFDGQLDEQAAADAQALRRSVQGTLGIDDASPVLGAQETGALESDSDDGEFNRASTDVPSADDPADDFGIGAAMKEQFGEDFLDDGSKSDGPDTDSLADDEDYEDDEDYDEDDFLARRRADQRRLHERKIVGRWRKIMTAGWAGLLIFWLVVGYGFIFQEENMRYYLPGTADFVYGIFEGGSDVEALREKAGKNLTPSPAEAEEIIRAVLIPDGVSFETIEGQQAMVVRGFIENNGSTGANVPVVLARILDGNSRELARFEIHPPGLIIRRGGKLDFIGYHSPVPAQAAQVAVDVVPGSKANRNGSNTGS